MRVIIKTGANDADSIFKSSALGSNQPQAAHAVGISPISVRRSDDRVIESFASSLNVPHGSDITRL